MRHGGQEMKKLIIIFLSIFIAIPNGYADNVDSCNPNTNPQDYCEMGCGIIPAIGPSCQVCPPGTFNPGLSQKCETCTKPVDAEFLTEEDIIIGDYIEYKNIAYGNTSDDCPWRLKCEAGKYWDGKTCQDCGQYYQDDNGTCTVIGRGDDNTQLNSPSCNFNNRCIGNEYKLILKPNGAILQGDIELCYKYGTGFAEKCGSTTWSQKLPKYHEDRPIKPFTGYYSDKNCGGVAIFDSEGNFNGSWSSLGGDKTLYACWKKLTQTIEYRDENKKPIPGSSHTCTADDNDNFECIAKAYQPTGDGVVFSKYKCTYLDKDGSEKNCKTEFLGIGDSIPELGEVTVYLTIQTVSCPKGHYCEAGTENNCPGGSTSDNGAEDINDCYMDKGTQFCDSVGCFNLPDGIKIYYQGGD